MPSPVPTVGGSNNTWGTELNAHLLVHAVAATGVLHNIKQNAADTNTHTQAARQQTSIARQARGESCIGHTAAPRLARWGGRRAFKFRIALWSTS